MYKVAGKGNKVMLSYLFILSWVINLDMKLKVFCLFCIVL